jgi:L-gulonate 5-dehydrogenase
MVAIAVEKPLVLSLRDDPVLTPGPGDVVIAVQRAGICGSDLHILHGSNPFAEYPRVIGHEMAGTVESVGSAVSGLAVGDHVVVDPVVSCGHCYPCRIGRTNVCANMQVIGVHRDGGFRDRMAVPFRNAVKVSPDLPFEIAALAEPLSVAANVLARTGCTAEDVVLIYGAGTVGITVLQVAKMFGARCIVTDPDAARLNSARQFGADVILNPALCSVAAAVAPELDGIGPSLVIDGAGDPALLLEACQLAAPAGRIGLLGFSADPSPVIQQEIVRKELTIVGSRLNRRLIGQVIEWLESGALRPAAMITHSFPAAQARAAFDLIETHPEQTLKVQLVFGQ